MRAALAPARCTALAAPWAAPGGDTPHPAADLTPGVEGAAGRAPREPSQIAADLLGRADRSADGADRGRTDLGPDLLDAANRGDDGVGHRLHESDRQGLGAVQRRADGIGHPAISGRMRGSCGIRICAKDSWLFVASLEILLWHVVR